MKKSLFPITLLFILPLFLSMRSFAAQEVELKCQVFPPMAKRFGPVKTQWKGTYTVRYSVAGHGKQTPYNITVAPDGFFSLRFPKPRDRGIELQVTIRIHGGFAYQTSNISLFWEGGQREPFVHAGSNSEVNRLGVYGDLVIWGVIFRMK